MRYSFGSIMVKLLIISGIALVLLWIISMIYNPVRRPRFMVRSHVLRLTPMGTHIDDAAEIIEGIEGWRMGGVNYEHGFVLPSAPNPFDYAIGYMSIRVWARPYWPSNLPIIGLLVQTSTSIFWGFDADGKLTDVYVCKSVGW